MKKKVVTAILLTAMMLSNLTACGTSTVDVPETSAQYTSTEIINNEAVTGYFVTDVTSYFKNNYRSVKSSYDRNVEFASKLAETCGVPFELASISAQPGELAGFNEPIQDFVSAVQFGPMIGSIPFVGYLFELEDGVSGEDFAENLKAAANLRWNICTEAETITVIPEGNTVLFIMHTNYFEE